MIIRRQSHAQKRTRRLCRREAGCTARCGASLARSITRRVATQASTALSATSALLARRTGARTSCVRIAASGQCPGCARPCARPRGEGWKASWRSSPRGLSLRRCRCPGPRQFRYLRPLRILGHQCCNTLETARRQQILSQRRLVWHHRFFSPGTPAWAGAPVMDGVPEVSLIFWCRWPVLRAALSLNYSHRRSWHVVVHVTSCFVDKYLCSQWTKLVTKFTDACLLFFCILLVLFRSL